jgi:hypothetical protein
MNVADGLSLLRELIEAATVLQARIQSISAIIARAKQEGRDDFTELEWQEIQAIDDETRDELTRAIERQS